MGAIDDEFDFSDWLEMKYGIIDTSPVSKEHLGILRTEFLRQTEEEKKYCSLICEVGEAMEGKKNDAGSQGLDERSDA